MAWDTGTITNAAPWAQISQKLKNLVGGTGVENWRFEENVPAGVGIGQSGSASFSLDVFRCRGSANLYKKIVQLNLANSQLTTDGTSFPHTITTPAASRFITVCVINTKASAADDPTGVTLDGSNAPTFTKIKSQAGGNTGESKMTLWIGKSSGSAPTGTQLTVAFGAATQTGCLVIVDQWDGVDLTLGADGVDATGATKIGIQVVGNNGTTETAHSATLAAMLGAQSVAVTWAAQTASAGTYTAEAGWTALAADLSMATPTAHARGAFRPDQDDLTGVMTLSSNASETSWCAIAFEFQRTTEATTVTSPNDSGKDWFFVLEIPVADGAVNSSFNSAENYDGNKLFRRMPPIASTTSPVGSGYWRDDTLNAYGSVGGNNRTSNTHQVLNTTGFSYWIKLTKNGVTISTRVGATEAMMGAMLLDSFVTNTSDLPLINVSSTVAAANTFSRLPGVTSAGGNNIWGCDMRGWTTATQDGFATNAAFAQDLWSSEKIHVARIFVSHVPGRSATLAFTLGYARGLWKTDWLCFARGGTVLLGDTMTIAGNTWTVISNSSILFGTGLAMCVAVRAN